MYRRYFYNDRFSNDRFMNNTKKNPAMMISIGLFVLFIVFIIVYFFTRSNTEKSNDTSTCELGVLGEYVVCQPSDNCPPDKNEKAVTPIVKEHIDCPNLSERTKYRYNTAHDCKLSEWSDWRPCEDGECTPGKNRIRMRTVISENDEHGTCTDSLREEQYVEPTVVDCILGDFGQWTKCTAADNCPENNNEYRRREIDQVPDGGNPCGEMVEYQRTEPVNCVTEWSEWKECAGANNCTPGNTIYKEKKVVRENNIHGTCVDRNEKEYANIPSWGLGKICGDTDGEYCFMPLGNGCLSDKNIPNDEPNGAQCKRAVQELTGTDNIQGYKTFDMPPHCSYKQQNDTHTVGLGSIYAHPSRFLNRNLGHHAVCLN